MYNGEQIYLTPQELLNHDFKIDARGYRPQEVDKILDMVIRDYTEFGRIIKAQERKINDLNDDNYTLKQEIRRLNSELEAAKEEKENTASQKNITNVDLLRRISQLEKIVYGKNE